jgi:hypothetical protein
MDPCQEKEKINVLAVCSKNTHCPRFAECLQKVRNLVSTLFNVQCLVPCAQLEPRRAGFSLDDMYVI